MAFDFSTLITDRSSEDLQALRDLLATPMSDWTAEQLAEFNRAASKGAYNYTDLNRVISAMDDINERLTGLGYETGYQRIAVSLDTSTSDEIDITPTMTSNTTPAGYIASASSVQEGNGEGAWQAFDGVESTATDLNFWHSRSGMPQWIMMQFPKQYAVAKFSITNSPNIDSYQRYGPKSFRLEGSNNGTEFITLGTYTSAGNLGETNEYTVEFPNSYTYYRIYITEAGYVYENQQYAVIEQIRFFISNQPDGPVSDLYTWYESDVPTSSLLSAYLANVGNLKSTLTLPTGTPAVPDDMEGLTQTEANNIEDILLVIQAYLVAMQKIVLQGGMVWAVSGGPSWYFGQ